MDDDFFPNDTIPLFGPGITPTAANVYAGIEQGRTHILRWYIAFIKRRDAGAVHESHRGGSRERRLVRDAEPRDR